MTDQHSSPNRERPCGCRVSVNRRDFIAVVALSAAALSCGVMPMALAIAADAPPPASAEVQDLYRPRFHFTPPKGWMNDPCGMFYHDGDYHLHYQWNPDLGGWGKHWAQVVSQDLIHWTPWPVSLSKDPVLGECWSGSGLVDADNTGGFKTGKEDVLVLVFTVNTASEGQAVGLAYSNDRGRTWTRYAQNPVIRRPDQNKDFRDPKVFWHTPSAKWILAISRGYTAPGNIYSSSDLKHWTLLGEVPNGECPDLFELPIEGQPGKTKWVYAAGDYPMTPNGAGAKYFLGDFDGKAFENRSPAYRFGGNFFVGQSFSHVPPADGRRIWMGWKWLDKYGTLGPWTGGIQTIPVALTLRDIPSLGLRLCQNPVKELQSLRGEHFHFDRQTIAERNTLLSSRGVQGELLEIIARFQLDTAAEFGLQLRQGPQGHCTVGYNTAKQEVFFAPAAGPNGPVQALAPRDKVVQLHILLDRSVVDIFGNDGIAWTCEFFKADPKNLGIELYAKGGTVQLLSLDLWKLNQPRLSPFDDAVAAWHMGDVNDSSGKNSRLTVVGPVDLAVALEGAEREASLRRGGDGLAARFAGGYLSAGQGADGELNLHGNALTMLLRLRDASGQWGYPLFAKHGGHTKLVYNIFSGTPGENATLGCELGSPEVDGVHKLEVPVAKIGPLGWHDVVLRFDGNAVQLFVDGFLRDDDLARSTIREGNTEPCLLGAEANEGRVKTGFQGLIDHAALWNRSLSDKEVAGLSGVESLGDRRPEYYHEKHRPQFHFTAKKHWINDPNGLVYYKGTYHLFFQHQPPVRPGAYKDWGHAVSTNLVHWKQLPEGIVPHIDWGGCWSGSAAVDWENTAGFQRGPEKTIVALLTNGGIPRGERQNWVRKEEPLCTQCIAYSTDGGGSFTYYEGNPVLGHIIGENRDPKLFWHAPTKRWIQALYLTGNDYALFASPDLKDWKPIGGLTLPGVSECPDFFELPVDGDHARTRWVFWGASGGHVIGTFDGRAFRRESEVRRADHGANFYAAQTWSDLPSSDGRSIQIAWMAGGNYPGMPFTQQLSFPCELTLRTLPEGLRLCRWPVREIESLREKHHSWKDLAPSAGNQALPAVSGDLFDIQAEIEPRTSGEIGIRVRGEPIAYDSKEHKLSAFGRSAPMAPVNGRIGLRVLVDRTSVEIFGNDGALSMSFCFLPKDENRSLEVFTRGEGGLIRSIDVWELRSIWP